MSKPIDWNDDPPEWAKDPFNQNVAYRCEYCGAWEEAVRPGKHQPTCDCAGRSESESE